MKKKESFLINQYATGLFMAACLLMIDTTVVFADVTTLEEIVVTARRRAENLQEIPESVSVLGSEIIENAGINNLRDLTKLVPNLSLFTGEQSFRAGVVQLVVRGVTTPQNGEAPMSFVVDGVTIPEIDFINQDLFDIESIQVLRGPQGALYGRGALGGAVLINTKQPTNEFSGFVKGSYEEGDDFRLKAGVSGPLVADTLFFRLSGSFTDRDGLINNTTLSDDVDFKESTIVRGGLKYLVNSDITIDWNFNYLESEVGGGIFSIEPIADLNRNFEDSIDSNVLGENKRDIFETSIKIEWDLGFATLTSISAYANVDDEIVGDADFGPAVLFAQRNASNIDSYTQEIRLTSADDQRLRWILGGFYQDRSKEFEFDFADDVGRTSGGFAQRFDVAFEQRDNTDSTATGVFAQLSYDITEQLELTGALRYDRDSRDFEDPRDPGTNTSESFDELQPKISLSYDWSEDLLVYVTYSHGFRSGGFNEIGFGAGMFGGPPTVYKAESSDSIEGGMKATLLDGRMTFNAAVFHNQLEDNQFTSFDINSFTLGILSINEAEVTGLDLEIAARPVDALDLSFGLGVSDSKIEDFDGTGANDGNNIPFVPDYTLNASAQYTWELHNGMNVISRIDYNRSAELSFDQENTANRDATDTINLRLAWTAPHWTLAGYVKNVTDERAPVDYFGDTATTLARAPNAPRAFGVEIRYDY
jgi:iron complex outermembrane recepter protein